MVASVLGTSIKTAIFSNTVEEVRVNVYNAVHAGLYSLHAVVVPIQ